MTQMNQIKKRWNDLFSIIHKPLNLSKLKKILCKLGFLVSLLYMNVKMRVGWGRENWSLSHQKPIRKKIK